MRAWSVKGDFPGNEPGLDGKVVPKPADMALADSAGDRELCAERGQEQDDRIQDEYTFEYALFHCQGGVVRVAA